MKLPLTDPLAIAAYNVVKTAAPREEPHWNVFRRTPIENFEIEFMTDGVFLVKPKTAGVDTITLGLKNFKALPIATVRTKGSKIMIGPKATYLSQNIIKGYDFKLLAEANLKEWKKNNK